MSCRAPFILVDSWDDQ